MNNICDNVGRILNCPHVEEYQKGHILAYCKECGQTFFRDINDWEEQ